MKDSIFQSCLLGGAIGDALGAPIEFYDISDIIQNFGKSGVTDFVEYSNGTGEFTDDTQMTLFTAEGLLRAFHWEMLEEIGATVEITYRSYLRWLYTQGYSFDKNKISQGVFDIENGWLIKRKELFKRRAPGNTCLSSLISGVAGSIDRPINNSKGCGGVMRVAPVGFMYFNDPEFAFKTASQIAALTHGHPSGYLPAGAFASILSFIMLGETLENSIVFSLQFLRKHKYHEETLIILEKAIDLALQNSKDNLEIRLTSKFIESIGLGWTGEEALAISIFCSIVFINNYKEGIIASVNHSGDSDSTGSITGNILGLINGIEQIPEKWILKLKNNDIVKEIANDLSIGCKSSRDNRDEDWRQKYPRC